MIMPGEKIRKAIQTALKKEVKKFKKPIKLVVFLVGEGADQTSFVAIKKRVAGELGIKFEFVHLKTIPTFEKFLKEVKVKSMDPETTGIIIQQPLPSQLDSDSVYDFIKMEKEIEGHRKKTTFSAPLGLAVLTALKYIYTGGKVDEKLVVDLKKDKAFFKRALRNERVVLMGRGITGGKPIGKTLTQVGVNFINVNSNTPNPEEYLREADIIITAVGKKVLDPSILKPGVILLNAGLRRENGKLKGDYEESEIKNVAKYYSPTPGGIGPLDVLYLYKNLIDAAKMQK